MDLDPETTELDVESLAALLTPGTSLVVFTHLYGARVDAAPALALARQRGVRFIEDCAEAYAGPEWRGHPDCDLALFSFGAIKTATAFGGGLARMADPAVRARMKELVGAYPVQPRAEYLGKVLKYGALGVAGLPRVFGPLVTILTAARLGPDALLHRMTRGFAGLEFFRQIRRRPCAPLLRLLERRLRQGEAPWRRRVDPGERLVRALGELPVPTRAARPHGYWLVAVAAPDAQALVDRLERAGFHGTRGRAFAVVENDAPVEAPEPTRARALHERLVFLPFSPQMPDGALARLARTVQDEVGRQMR